MPKTPEELKEEIEKAQESPADEGHERTAESEEVRTPGRDEFFGNLEKVSKPTKE